MADRNQTTRNIDEKNERNQKPRAKEKLQEQTEASKPEIRQKKNGGSSNDHVLLSSEVAVASSGTSAIAGDDRDAVISTDGKAVVSISWKVPDGGWGWVVVLSSLVISLILDGVSYTFGVFLGDLESAFQAPKSTIALANSLQVGVYLFVGPVVSALTNRFGCRLVIVFGSLLAGLSFVASAFSTNVTMLIMMYGAVGGIGFGLMYLPAIVAVSVYFEERRAMATGIAVCGSGIGTFILAPLTDYLLSEYSWRGTLLLLAGLVLQGMIFGALVRPLDLQPIKHADNVGDTQKGKDLKTTPHSRNKDLKPLEKATPRRDGIDKSTNGLPQRELVPLISVTDELDRARAVHRVDKPGRFLFSSAPDMQGRSNSRFEQSVTEKDNYTPPNNNAEKWKPRRRTQSTSDRTEASQPYNPMTHAPVGLALISLSDAQINKIREEVDLALSRKDIHLSGPLALTDEHRGSGGEERKRGLYIQSIQSIVSLAEVDALEDSSRAARGLWSCLPKSARETLEEMLDFSILKDLRYWFVLLGNFSCMVGFYVPFVYIPDRAKQIGIPEDKAAFLISIIGITNTLGRVLAGVSINFLSLDCIAVTSGALTVAGITTVLCPFCVTYPTLAAASAVFGFCVAAYISLCSVLLCELLGVENLTNAFGFVILFRGVACIIGPPLAGAIIDATGIFDPSFYVGGGMIALGGLSHAVLLLPWSRRRKR